MKKLILVPFLLFYTINMFSQPVVVSEYKDASPDGEWTELLVIRDMFDIVGFTMRDNSEAGQWQPSIRFKDTRLWRNLREGTIIVINHRGGVIDDDKSDGYIEIGRDAKDYFDTYIDGNDPGHDPSLNLNGTHDMIQLRDASANHVHLLAHLTPGRINDVFAGVPNPKVGSPNTAARSIRVYPGDDIGKYSGGLSAALALSDFAESKGLPNGDDQGKNTNHYFWRTLREPSWQSPANLTAQISADYKNVVLNWNPASSIKDDNEGYVIIRYISSQNQILNLEDGKIYKPGDNIGIYTVIDTLPDLTNYTFTDSFRYGTFECGEKYKYRLYIYRYQATNYQPYKSYDSDPVNARGRSYNETEFYEIPQSIEKTIPPVPVLTTLDGKIEYCSNEEVFIESDIKDLNKYDFVWYDGLLDLGINDFKYKVNKSGLYRIVIKDKLTGCETTSNELNINFIDASTSLIRSKTDNKTFSTDTIIQICVNDKLRMQGISIPPSTKNTYYWLKDEVVVGNNTDLDITQSGIYKFVVVTNGLCSDSSIILDVRVFNPDYDIKPSKVNFDFDSNPSQNLTINNNSDQDLVFYPADISIIPSGEFVISNPIINQSNPLIVPAKGSINITIEFQTVDYGTKTAKLSLKSICNVSRNADLEGVRANTGSSKLLSNPPANINFGKIPNDCDELNTKLLQLTISGPKNLDVILQPFSSTNFKIENSVFVSNPVQNLISNSIETITVRLTATTTGVYSDVIKFAWRNFDSKSDYDTLKINLFAEIIDIKFVPDTIKFDFSMLPNCINSIDTNFTLRINPAYQFNIKENFSDNKISISQSLPVALSPDEVNILKVRINFTDGNLIKSNLLLEPCGKNLPFEIIPPQSPLKLTYLDTIDFGKVNNCEFSGDFFVKYQFKTSHEIKISEVLYENENFLIELNKGYVLKQGINELFAIFPMIESGFLTDSVKFVIEPCSDTITIYFKGERIDLKPASFDMTELNFGTEFKNQKGVISLKISNDNISEDLIISNIMVPFPFKMLKPIISEFPLTIKANSFYDAEFEFSREIAGDFSDSITFQTDKPCTINQKLSIVGSSVDQGTYNIIMNLPDQLTVELNNKFVLPLETILPSGFSASASNLQILKFHFSYDPAILDIIDAKSLASTVSLNSSSNSFAGKFVAEFKLIEPQNFVDGDLIELEIEPLLGYKLQTLVKLDSVIYTASTNIETLPDSSNIKIIGECNIENRTIEINGTPSLKVINGNPIEGTANIDFTIMSDELTTINLFNSLGEKILVVVNQNLKAGSYYATFDSKGLPSGNYFLTLENGINLLIVPISLIH